MDIEIKTQLNALKNRFEKINNFDTDKLKKEVSDLENQLQSPEIWANQKKASELGSKIRDIKDNLDFVNTWQGVLDDCETAFELGDEDLILESVSSLNEMEKAFDKFEIKQMLNGEYDEADAILTINAGAGGTDAQDWASMLLRMYMRWAENKGWKVDLMVMRQVLNLQQLKLQANMRMAIQRLKKEFIGSLGFHLLMQTVKGKQVLHH